MYTVLAFVIGAMFAAGLYMMMRRSMIKLAIGLVLLTQASNLLIFTVGGLVRTRPPIVGPQDGTGVFTADPLPQALILTAIVISLGVLAFLLVLLYRVYEVCGSDDMDDIRAPEV